MTAGWEARFLALAEHVAGWSKDPSTRTGCVIVRPGDRTVASMGYNGLPRGVADDPARLAHRPTKLAMTVHAEVNAIAFATEKLRGYSAFIWPLFPCSTCAGALIQAGIGYVCAPEPTEEQRERWGDSWALARTMLNEAEVAWHTVAP